MIISFKSFKKAFFFFKGCCNFVTQRYRVKS